MEKTQAFLDLHGITQTELAEALGVTCATVSRKLGGLRNWKLGEVQAVLEWLSTRLERAVSYDEVFGADAHATLAAAPLVAPSSDPSAA
jgi:transcriptional regulator with XRE-family HTH domain